MVKQPKPNRTNSNVCAYEHPEQTSKNIMSQKPLRG